MNIHSHGNNQRTHGLAEFVFEINGNSAMSRHNDFAATIPSDKPDFHTVRVPEWPPVPASVLAKPTIEEMNEELANYFIAFKAQNVTHRDYRPYFKSLLCYLEIYWGEDTHIIEEPFFSDRHHLAERDPSRNTEIGKSLNDAGRKHQAENVAMLSQRIRGMTYHKGNASAIPLPILSQFNYRILCHETKEQPFPLKNVNLMDGMPSRIAKTQSQEAFGKSRLPCFNIKTDVIDALMSEIPGKNNYVQTTLIGKTEKGEVMHSALKNETLNAGYYFRQYRTLDGSVYSSPKNSFPLDKSLYIAHSTQDRISPISTLNRVTENGVTKCKLTTKRVSYAMPMELTYLSPLLRYNPYNITHHGNVPEDVPAANSPKSNGRNGGLTKDKAYDGVNNKLFFRCPEKFFEYFPDETFKDNGDTTGDVYGVLDPSGEVKRVKGSGMHVMIGDIRLRYPMGSQKYLGSYPGALGAVIEDIVNAPLYHGYMFNIINNRTGGFQPYKIELFTSNSGEPKHCHTIRLTEEQVHDLTFYRTRFYVRTSTNGVPPHSHHILLKYKDGKFRITTCDGNPNKCPDLHKTNLQMQCY